MTDMKRTTVSFPDEIVFALEELKQSEEYAGCTYSEIIRRLVVKGLENEPAAELENERESA